MEIKFTPRGVCAKQIIVNAENGIIKDVKFIGGCSGNTQGVGSLAKGMKIEEVISRLENIKCGSKPTSCPAQLAKCLKDNF